MPPSSFPCTTPVCLLCAVVPTLCRDIVFTYAAGMVFLDVRDQLKFELLSVRKRPPRNEGRPPAMRVLCRTLLRQIRFFPYLLLTP
jgi:hypothetical protein